MFIYRAPIPVLALQEKKLPLIDIHRYYRISTYCKYFKRELLEKYRNGIRCEIETNYSTAAALPAVRKRPLKKRKVTPVKDINLIEKPNFSVINEINVISMARPIRIMKKIDIFKSCLLVQVDRPMVDSAKPKLDTNIYPTTSKNTAELDNQEPKLSGRKIKKQMAKIEQQKQYAKQLLDRKTFSLNNNLLAFLSVCANSDDYNLKAKACDILMKIILMKKYSLKLETINQAFRCAQQPEQFDAIVRFLKESDTKPNIETFSYLLSGLGQFCSTKDNLNDIQDALQWMQNEEISLKTLFTCGTFPKQSFRNCLEAVIRAQPEDMHTYLNFNFNIETLRAKHKYSNILVNHLNESMFSETFTSPYQNVSKDCINERMNKQLDLESKGFDIIPSIYKDLNPKETELNEAIFDKLEQKWREKLRTTIDKQKLYKKNVFFDSNTSSIDIYPFLASVDTNDIVNMLILEIHKICRESFCAVIQMSSMEKALGRELYLRYVIGCKRDHHRLDILKQAYIKYSQWYNEGSLEESSSTPRVQWEKLIADSGTNILRDSPLGWPSRVEKVLGHLLYSTLFMCITVLDPDTNEEIPAFTRVHISNDNRVIDKLQISLPLIKIYNKFQTSKLVFSTSEFPMIVPSLPWITTNTGGYLLTKSQFVRTSSTWEQDVNTTRQSADNSLFPVMDSLNQLGCIPWKINKEMLKLICEIFKNGGWNEMDLPGQFPIERPPPDVKSSMSLEEKKQLAYQHKLYIKEKKECYSSWCSTLYKISLCNHFRDREFWLPNNMDFRGRVYPIPPHLNHLSADVFRSMLLFAKGKPLGPKGLDWLKLQVINMTGLKKKCSLSERLEFADEIRDEIFDSADNPIDGRKWWTKADEPWQTLASCKELTAAIRSEDPEKYISHLPIHQDGSCNGLQHYAALARDNVSAKSVNLRPSEVPQDVYSDVVVEMERCRKLDADNGLNLASALEGYVLRKVIKQTIMTTVYGVTVYGAKHQIEKQLNYLDFPKELSVAASSYLARNVFASLQNLFMPTRKIQDWLVECAVEISKVLGCNVEWVTPLGLHVCQPYSKQICFKQIGPNYLSNLTSSGVKSKPCPRKNRNGFPPNFIHSLDSSHMMLTSIHCQHAKIFFASIHDCFWTHASTVDIMNKICREQFSELHSQPILEDLSKSFMDNYNHLQNDKECKSDDNVFLNIPEKGSLDLKQVLKSTFFFS